MKTWKYFIAAVLAGILGMSAAAWAIPTDLAPLDDQAILKLRPEGAKLPPTDTALLYHMVSVAILDSGRVDRTERICRYLRSDNAWDDYGDPHIGYDEARQLLTVYAAISRTTDGRTVQTDPTNGYNPMVPFELDQAADFAHYRYMVVTHVGIEADAVTDLAWTLRELRPLYPWTWGEITFGGNEPQLDKLVLVGAPQTENLRVFLQNGLPDPEHWVDNGRDIYGWRMKDLPARNMAEAGSRPADLLPKVAYSTCPNWKVLTEAVNARFTQALDQQGDLAQHLAAFGSLPEARQKLDSVVTFLKDRIVRVNFPDLGMLINYRTAERTFSSGYGSPADLAVLTAAALKDLGFDPQVCLSARNLLPLPGFSGKEAYLIRVQQDDLDALIDPVSGNIHWHGPQDVALVGIYPAHEPQVIPADLATDNAVSVNLGLTLKDDKTATGWVIVESRGALSQFDKVQDGKVEDLVKAWTDKLPTAPEISNARITALVPDYTTIQADLKFPAIKDTLDDFLRITIPWDATGMDGFAPHGLALNYPSRDLPLFLDHDGTFDLNVQVSYPESWKPAAAPQAKEAQAKGITLTRTVASDKGMLRLHERVEFSGSEISPQAWDGWRKVALAAGKTNDRSLLLKAE